VAILQLIQAINIGSTQLEFVDWYAVLSNDSAFCFLDDVKELNVYGKAYCSQPELESVVFSS
jgi:hypothetical protein